MSLLQSGFPNGGRNAGKIVVVESPQGEVASCCVPKAERDCLNGGHSVLFSGLPECEWLVLERLQSDLPPNRGIAFTKGAYFHPFHSRVIAGGLASPNRPPRYKKLQ